MLGNFENCFTQIEVYEGWHKSSHNSNDPGGLTYSGVTQSIWAAYCAHNGLPICAVTSMSDGQCYDLYKVQYWDAVKADTLPVGIDLIVYDEAVNSGPVRSIMNLQGALGVTIDGHFGVETAAAVAAANDIHSLIVKFDLNRMSFIQRLSNFQIFGRGWTSRVNDVTARALKMAGV